MGTTYIPVYSITFHQSHFHYNPLIKHRLPLAPSSQQPFLNTNFVTYHLQTRLSVARSPLLPTICKRAPLASLPPTPTLPHAAHVRLRVLKHASYGIGVGAHEVGLRQVLVECDSYEQLNPTLPVHRMAFDSARIDADKQLIEGSGITRLRADLRQGRLTDRQRVRVVGDPLRYLYPRGQLCRSSDRGGGGLSPYR